MPMRILGRGRDAYVIAGYLQKRGRWSWQWSERYFVLTPSALHYYKKEKNQLFGEERGHFLVEDMIVRPLPEKRCFEIFCQDKSRILKAATEREFLTWAKAFEDVQVRFGRQQRQRNREKENKEKEKEKNNSTERERERERERGKDAHSDAMPPLVRSSSLPDDGKFPPKSIDNLGLGSAGKPASNQSVQSLHRDQFDASVASRTQFPSSRALSGDYSRDNSFSRDSLDSEMHNPLDHPFYSDAASSSSARVSQEPLLLVTVETPAPSSLSPSGSAPASGEVAELIAGRNVEWNHQLYVPGVCENERDRSLAVVATLSDGTKVRVDKSQFEGNRGERDIFVDDPYRPITVRVRWNAVAAPVSPQVTKRLLKTLILPAVYILFTVASLVHFSTVAEWITIFIGLLLAFQFAQNEWTRFLEAKSAKMFFVTFVSMKERDLTGRTAAVNQAAEKEKAAGQGRGIPRFSSLRRLERSNEGESTSNSVDTSESDQESRSSASSGLKSRRNPNQRSPQKAQSRGASSRANSSELSQLALDNATGPASDHSSRSASRRSSGTQTPQLIAAAPAIGGNTALSIAAAQIISGASLANSSSATSSAAASNNSGKISRVSQLNEAAETAAFLQAGNTILGSGVTVKGGAGAPNSASADSAHPSHSVHLAHAELHRPAPLELPHHHAKPGLAAVLADSSDSQMIPVGNTGTDADAQVHPPASAPPTSDSLSVPRSKSAASAPIAAPVPVPRSASAGVPRPLFIDEESKHDFPSASGSFSPADSTASSASFDSEAMETEAEPFPDESETISSSASASSDQLMGHGEYFDSPSLLQPVIKGLLPPTREAPWGRWTEDDISKLLIRGPTFKQDKIKIPCGTPVYKLAHVDQFHTNKDKYYHVASRPDSYASLRYEWKMKEMKAKGLGMGSHPLAPMIVINLMYPGPEERNFNLVLYFIRRIRPVEIMDSKDSGAASDDDFDKKLVDVARLTAFDRVMAQFLSPDSASDEFRDCRFKIIPRIAEGPWLVRKGVGCTPAILGKKISQSYQRDPVKNYFEIDADVGSSIMAGKILQLVKSAATSLVIELSFLLQGETPDELPESMLGGCRLHNVDLGKILHYDENVKRNNVVLI